MTPARRLAVLAELARLYAREALAALEDASRTDDGDAMHEHDRLAGIAKELERRAGVAPSTVATRDTLPDPWTRDPRAWRGR